MKGPYLVLLMAGVLLAGCGQKAKQTSTASAATNTAPSDIGNPLKAPVNYLGAIDQAKKYSEKTIRTAQLTEAIRDFHAGEGRYPKSLQELVTSGYMPRLPHPPYGMKFDYNPANGQFRVVRK